MKTQTHGRKYGFAEPVSITLRLRPASTAAARIKFSLSGAVVTRKYVPVAAIYRRFCVVVTRKYVPVAAIYRRFGRKL